MQKLIAALSVMATLSLSNAVFGADFSQTKEKLKAAMASDMRTEKEVARDSNRRPIETLEFFGFREDMKVIELLPGGGWYTKLLAPALAENGEFFVAYGTGRVKDRLAEKPGFEKMKIVAEQAEFNRPEGSRFYSLANTGLGVKRADMVLTFRNYHNFDDAARDAMNKSVFKALKSGGVYAVVDHTRRHMQKDGDENRRRFDPVKAIKEIEAAGFEFVDYSDLHYRLDDELRYEVGRKSVTGNTDRWTLKFRKP
ncbi:MAG: class I SAM-dependent methyltransferase [Halioglobus sp.]